MTDRELLEAAAKAAGYEGLGAWDDKWGCLTDHEGWTFDPLNDDGDALRLAVKVDMDIDRNYDIDIVCRFWFEDVVKTLREPINGDPYAATRRAIVRAAAEIGRGMG